MLLFSHRLRPWPHKERLTPKTQYGPNKGDRPKRGVEAEVDESGQPWLIDVNNRHSGPKGAKGKCDGVVNEADCTFMQAQEIDYHIDSNMGPS